MFDCDHPFIMGMDYLFQNDLRLYFVMPFVQGLNLGDLIGIKKKSPFKEKDVKFFAAQIVLALGYLHKKDIVFGDLHIDNIILDSEGYIKLINYGRHKMYG